MLRWCLSESGAELKPGVASRARSDRIVTSGLSSTATGRASTTSRGRNPSSEPQDRRAFTTHGMSALGSE